MQVSSTYISYRFPRKIISHCAWLYHRFTLSFREIELALLSVAPGQEPNINARCNEWSRRQTVYRRRQIEEVR